MRIETSGIVFSIVLTILPTMLLPSIWRWLRMQTKTFSQYRGFLLHFLIEGLTTYQSRWCHLWLLSWPSSRSSSCWGTASARAPPSQAVSVVVLLLVVVVAAGTAVDVLELLGCPGGLLLVGRVAVPVIEPSYSAVEVVVTETLLDVVLAFVMELTKVENLELELLGRNCDFELLPTSPWPRGSSPASTSVSSCPSPPCSCCAPCTWPGCCPVVLCCAPCTWPGWARRELSALLGGFLVQEVRRTWSDGKLGLEL